MNAKTHVRSQISRGSAELAILALLEKQPLYGFEIARQIEDKSKGALRFTLASLYPMLYSLEKRGSAELAILALLEKQPLYGFEIARQIEDKSKGDLKAVERLLFE